MFSIAKYGNKIANMNSSDCYDFSSTVCQVQTECQLRDTEWQRENSNAPFHGKEKRARKASLRRCTWSKALRDEEEFSTQTEYFSTVGT